MSSLQPSLRKSSAEDTFTNRPNRTPKRQQLPEEVASYVRELIISGDVKPGDFLRMERIAEAVGVSNTPVREGLLLLSSEGFVKPIPRRGFVVAGFSPQDVRDLFWAQAVIGGELAYRAAQRITQESLARLEEMNESYAEAALRGDDDALVDLGHLFHREINLAAESPRLALVMGTVVKQLPNRFYAAIEGQVLDSRGEHPLILEALRAGDSEGARELVMKHIGGAADRLVDMLRKRGLWDDQAVAKEGNL
ncbi:GntR family transcriptional regulator [Pseudarthrobacter sp. NPDC080039]|uniref:GntR family transcriptional regulator n=1 Tax=unclassified Pseudarthrobacter TaxID=2647000 RepID=UPI00344E81CE